MKRVLVVIGTRPEAIKLFPVVTELSRSPALNVLSCTTGQHGDLVDPILAMAGIVPDIELNVMRPGQSLDAMTGRLVCALGEAFDRHRPDLIVVQGDTASAMTAALVALYRRIPVAHVEAGLRSGSLHDPCPEEGNRRIISALTTLHFAPTTTAAATLRGEKVTGQVLMTGNTVIDALATMRDRLLGTPELAGVVQPVLDRYAGKHLILTTVHRRESVSTLEGIAGAIRQIADRGDAAILLPVHPNPAIGAVLHTRLDHHPNIALTSPLDYPSAIRALSASYFVLTDSGGLQEEAPFFGKPVLVMRDTTERPEGIAAGTARLVGTRQEAIIAAAEELLDHPSRRDAMATRQLFYGDGTASRQIASAITAFLRHPDQDDRHDAG